MSLIRKIQINKLNGRSNVELKLNGSHCVIVGQNGTGKSTALQIIAYALGRNWKGLSDLRFETLHLTFFDGRTAAISKKACQTFFKQNESPRFNRAIRVLLDRNLIDDFSAADLTLSSELNKYIEVTRMAPSDLRMVQRMINRRGDDRASHREVSDFQLELARQDVPPTLYLPTYRRVELELSKILGDDDPYRDQLISSITTGINSDFLVELIRFGMEDITQSIQSFERQTRDFARNRFNKMMTSYLAEMANSEVLSVGDLRSHNINSDTIEVVLSRIEEGLLKPAEKEKISSIILELSQGPGAGNQPFNKKWLAHFFVRLLEVNQDIESKEKPIRSLVDTLSRYFYPKSVSYDIESYHFSIIDKSGDELKLSDLSSGEKQLVSILSQLNLTSAGKKINIFIDEPELSLSVPWQTDLLPDIANTAACNQVFAVTHSPFIYDNRLADSVVDFAPTVEVQQ